MSLRSALLHYEAALNLQSVCKKRTSTTRTTKMTNAWIKGAMTFAVLTLISGAMLAQTAVDLPGMDVVISVKKLVKEDVTTHWQSYAAEATLVSQGWTEVKSLKAGLVLNESYILPGIDVAKEILELGLEPKAQAEAYKTAQGTFVILASRAMIDKWTDRYIINAQAQLKK